MSRRIFGWMLLVCAALLLSIPVLAEEPVDTRTSHAVAGFKEGGAVTPPVDPDNPGKRPGGGGSGGSGGGTDWTAKPDRELVTIKEAEEVPLSRGEAQRAAQYSRGATGAAGYLTIDYITVLDFGGEAAREEDGGWVYYNRQERPYLQVSDLRGSAQGWKITASAGRFTLNGDVEIPVLLGLFNGSPLSTNLVAVPPDAERAILLPAGGGTPRRVLTAEPGSGMGTWVNRWYTKNGKRDAVLQVFQRLAEDDRVEGYITWTINDAP